MLTGVEIYRTSSIFEPVEPQPWQPVYHLHVDNGAGRCHCGATVTVFELSTPEPLRNGESVTITRIVNVEPSGDEQELDVLVGVPPLPDDDTRDEVRYPAWTERNADGELPD